MIHFRPHHFLCTLGFEGKGYSVSFIKNYKQIAKLLKGQEEELIQVVTGLDSVCNACPHQRTADQCHYQEKIDGLDKAHAEVLRLKEGEILSWKQAKERIKDHMTLEKFHQSCARCEWKGMGVCEQALRKLRDEGE